MSNQDPFETPPPSGQPGGGAYSSQPGPQEAVPNATAVLVLGILSIPTCFIYGIVGIALGIIALVLAKKGDEAYKENPDRYQVSSYNNLKAGRICGIIGLILSALFLLYIIIVLAFYGSIMSNLMGGGYY